MRARVATFVVGCCGLLMLAAGCASSSAPKLPADQLNFGSPEAAVTSLVDAVRRGDITSIKQILGPHGDDIVSSGDPVADRADAMRFLSLYDEQHTISPDDGTGERFLIVGKDVWPFPVPIIKAERRYAFDTETGREEILNRRIGRNELAAEQVCLAVVDAQRDYAAMRPTGSDLPEYARKLVSDRGQRNGLYWPTKADEPPSPLGPMVASASAEGYGDAAKAAATTRPNPPAYHGYRYHLLTAQGPHASGGEMQYLVNDRLIGGFGVVAYPAQYGNSGIMTFITNHDGVVYQRDLGPDTERAAKAMTTFDPSPEWTKSADAASEVAQR
jgi:hypothetical protein